MALISKHLDFRVSQYDWEKRETKYYLVYSRFDVVCLGEIKWYSRWRQYCFFPSAKEETVWSSDCLQELANFINDLWEEWRKEHQRDLRAKSSLKEERAANKSGDNDG